RRGEWCAPPRAASAAAAGQRRHGERGQAHLQASVMISTPRAPQGRTLAELERCSQLAGTRLVGGGGERVVVDVTQDSRRVAPGALFVARGGQASDWRLLIADALDNVAAS